MPLQDLYQVVREASRDKRNALKANRSQLANRLLDVFLRTWDLGFTAFGGPPVHFKIIHQRFVEGVGGKTPWMDEQTYQELFAICQALPGPGSTKMLFCVVWLHAGFIPALITFLVWSLPAAACMFGLAVGVGHIQQSLPDPVYALLSGLNAATVGIIALAAVQLAGNAIKDRLSRILVIFGATAGLCYTALWYFPILMVAGGTAAVIWDLWLGAWMNSLWETCRKKKTDTQVLVEETEVKEKHLSQESDQPSKDPREVEETDQTRESEINTSQEQISPSNASPVAKPVPQSSHTARTEPDTYHTIPVWLGISIIVVFFASFIAIMVLRSTLSDPPRPLQLFSNMYLAGTIIFGGGPVVIPLLREYVVQPGWVLPRDFLIGLAIIQAAPGPNFNFAVYLGALALRDTSWAMILGAFLGYVGIFIPGLALAVGVQSLWSVLRKKKYVTAALRGINAAAVGLVFTAVYRLWEIGYLTKNATAGQSLAMEPWWVVVATLSYAVTAWFHVPPAGAIVGGAVLGLCWYGAVGRNH